MAGDKESLQKLATDPTLAGFPPGATIDPRVAPTVASVDESGPSGTVKIALTEAAPKAKLPRISVSGQSESKIPGRALPSAGSGSSGADLEVVGLLGEGGMGCVHLARQKSLDRDVALKTLKGDSSATASDALISEAVITGSLEHPGIVPVHALGVDQDSKPLLVMKRVEGVEWRALIHDETHEEWSRWSETQSGQLAAHVEILAQVCNAAHFAHSRSVVHRDIKPENVMLGRFGEVYLVDWGVAMRFDREPTSRFLAGSPAYMAPEMVTGDTIDARTDVYLLGASLHEVLTKRMPHDGTTMSDVLERAATSDPHTYAPSVPKELADLCHRTMAKDPADRPRTALEVRQALLEYLRHRGSIELAESALERLEALERQLEETPGQAPANLSLANRRVTEARFGFTQALREWDGNAPATDGLQRCIERMIEIELLQDNGRGARALLDDLPEPRPELEQRVADLERKLELEARSADKLRALEKDLDQSVGARQRLGGVLAVGGFTIAITAWSLLRGPDAAPVTAGHLLVVGGLICASAVAVVAIWGRPMFQNQFNRRVLGAALSVLAMVLINRLFGFFHGLDVATIFMLDLLIVTAVAMATAATLLAWLWATVPIFLAGALAILIRPDGAVPIFTVSTMVGLVILGYFWSRQSRHWQGEEKTD